MLFFKWRLAEHDLKLLREKYPEPQIKKKIKSRRNSKHWELMEIEDEEE
jgi:hypothetical protein